MEMNLEENKQNPVQDFTQMSQEFYSQLKLSREEDEADPPVTAEEGEEEEDEEDFSFMFEGLNVSPIAAEDAFVNGQIKPLFPLFNQDLYEDLPMRPQVKKIFVETRDGVVRPSSSENDDIKVVEASPEVCTKSNSTGFSKVWRFKDSMGRSNSDGRDAFVFLNNTNTASSSSTAPAAEAAVSSGSGRQKKDMTMKVNGKVKNGNKKSIKTTCSSAHEQYLKSKAKEEGRRKSYLPYRPGLVGFFTNLNGSLTRNVHPF